MAVAATGANMRSALLKHIARQRLDWRRILLGTTKARAPVDTGALRANIKGGRGDVLMSITGTNHWYWNEIGVPHPGNRANRRWLTRAIYAFVQRTGLPLRGDVVLT